MGKQNKNIRRLLFYGFSLALAAAFFISCSGDAPSQKKRVFEGYGSWMDTVLVSPDKVVRGVEPGMTVAELKKLETIAPAEEDSSQLYYEIKADSLTDASVSYSISEGKVDEIELTVRSKNHDAGANVFSDLVKYLERKYQSPVEEKGILVFSGKTSAGEPLKISLEDQSGMDNGQVSLLVYLEK